MKVALCFSGVVRTFEECWPSYHRILDKYDCDIFGASPPNDTLYKYPFKKLLYQQDEWIDEKHYNSFKNPETIVQNSLRQFYFIELCNRLRATYEKDKNVKYDFIIRTRFDNLLVDDIIDLNQCNPNNIYIPTGHDHPMAKIGVGINDRFAIGGDHAMNVYSNKLHEVDDYLNAGIRFHPETILKWVLDRHQINIIRFPECTKINRGNNELL